ncbi:MAG: DUF2605 domain-containing protein, partial [Cyanobacteria bacterium P01_D01_bin.73]
GASSIMISPDSPPELPSDSKLLEVILEPLLDDFQYWFTRSLSLLESKQLDCLSPEEQTDLLERIRNAQREVTSTQSLFKAMGAQVGVSMSTIIPWHQLVAECWNVAMRHRQSQSASEQP